MFEIAFYTMYLIGCFTLGYVVTEVFLKSTGRK